MYKRFLNKKDDNQKKIIQIPTNLIYINSEESHKAVSQKRLRILCQSIKQNGILQPVILRSMPNGLYQLVCGANRLRAVKMVGIKTIPSIILELSDEDIVNIIGFKKDYIFDREEVMGDNKKEDLDKTADNLKTKKENKNRGSSDTRIFLNTIIKAVDVMKKAGVSAFLVQKESNDRLEIKIKIKKEQQ